MPAPQSNRRTGLGLAAVVALMVGGELRRGAVLLLVLPGHRLRRHHRRRRGARGPGGVVDRMVTVHFDANTAPDMPWEFRPKQRSMTLRLGETGLAFFEAYNPTDRPLAGQAGYNVVPFSVGGYFDKIACFCFEMQVLQPGRAGGHAGQLLRRPRAARRPRDRAA